MVHDEIRHPDRVQLAAFGLGKLDPQEAAEIESHVAGCDSCCETLGSLENDTFVDLVCSSETVEDSPAPQADGSRSSESNWRDLATLPPAAVQQSAAQHEQPVTDETAAKREAAARQPVAAADGSSAGVMYLPPDLAGHSRYEVLELLGTGGMGSVYKAEHRLMERTVALKVIISRLTSNAAAVERFRREVKAAARLSHPNIVAAYDAEQAGSLQLLVMEFVDGTDLGAAMRKRKQLPVAEACDYVRQAATGLQHAFEYGMVHRDIKPQNLMLTPDGQVKILDFGLAQLAGEAAGQELTREGSMMGTPDYMAPEQARDARTADIRADIYSLGCTLYALLTGQPPFPEGSEIAKVMAHTEREPKPVSEFRGDVPVELIAVLRRMTAKDPRERFQTPTEVADALEPFLSARPAVSPKRPASRWKVGAVVAATLLLLAGVIFVVTDHGQLKIESFDDDVEIIVSKEGREITIIDLKTDSKVRRLSSGEYKIALKDRTDLKLNKTGFTLSRGDEVLVEVQQVSQADVVAVDLTGAGKLSEREQAGLKAALSWLKIVDDGKYAESRDRAAEILRSGVTADKWKRMMTPVRKPLGGLIYRELRQARFATELPDVPRGKFVVLEFKTDFERGKRADETIITILEGNDRWRVASYVVMLQPGAEPALSVKERAALKATLAWLKILDADKYAKSREAAAEIFRSGFTTKTWTQAMAPIRQQIGKLVDRKLKQARYTTELPNAPPGEFVVLEFNSYFRKGKGASETITAILERNKRWRVAGYEVIPRKTEPVMTQQDLASDFEAEKANSAWTLSTDNLVGGKSTAKFERVEGGAEGSQGSLLITGTIADRPFPRWAGVTFYPGPSPMAPIDLSAKKFISFHAKGDGKSCFVMLFFQKRGIQPSTKIFFAGTKWMQHRFEIEDFDGCDGSDIIGVFFGGGTEPGEFRLQIDDVRFESPISAIPTTPTNATRVRSKSAPANSGIVRSFTHSDTTITQDGISPDDTAWKIQAKEPRTVRMFEVNDLDLEHTRLVYRAKMKSEDLKGKAYLEMWVRSPGLGEFFSKGLTQTASGTSGWATYETPFFLQKGQRVDLAKLNLVIEGEGTVWIKQVELLTTPLPVTQPAQ